MANHQTQQDSISNRDAHTATSWRESPVGASSGSVERDETYGLVSVLYHALQGAETYGQYIADADRAGESELSDFFKECQEQENRRALRAKQLLAMKLDEFDDYVDEEEDEDDAEEED